MNPAEKRRNRSARLERGRSYQKLPLQRVIVPVRLDWGKGTAGNSHLPEAKSSLQAHAARCKRYNVSAKHFSRFCLKIEDAYPEKVFSLSCAHRRPCMVGAAGLPRHEPPCRIAANVDVQLAEPPRGLPRTHRRAQNTFCAKSFNQRAKLRGSDHTGLDSSRKNAERKHISRWTEVGN
jgi:hypothetical protein